MAKILYIIRGLPGSGKNTLGTALTNGSGHVYSADDYFMDFEGKYNFDPTKIGAAHESCQDGIRNALVKGYSPVAVANTFSQKWEAEPYFKMAGENGYTVVVLECQSEFGSVHGVPAEAIAAMAAGWETCILPTKKN
jgi:predicted kinase